jgi:hypothetical protein
MSDTIPEESHPILDEAPQIEIELIPLEDDDLDTIAAVEEVGRALKDKTATPDGYVLVEATQEEEAEDLKARGGVELFQLISGLSQTVHDQQDVVKILIGAGLSVIGLLLKQRRVKKFEVTVGQKTLHIEKADQQAVQAAMQQFEVLCREEVKAMASSPKLKVKAHVSKKSTHNKNRTKHKK